MGLFGNKYNKIKRSDINDAVCELEKAQQKELQDIEARNTEIEKNMVMGRKSKDRTLQLALAKRINMLKAENQKAAKRIQYLNGNIQAMNRLKTALDERDFIVNNSKLPLNKLLSNPTQLRKFLNGVTINKQKQEAILGDTLDIFEENEENYVEDERIYGVNKNDDSLLAMFESENNFEDAVNFGMDDVSEAKPNNLDDYQ